MNGLGIGLSRPGRGGGASASPTRDRRVWRGRSAIPNASVSAFVDGVQDDGAAVAEVDGTFTYEFAVRPPVGKPVRFECVGWISTPIVLSPPDYVEPPVGGAMLLDFNGTPLLDFDGTPLFDFGGAATGFLFDFDGSPLLDFDNTPLLDAA